MIADNHILFYYLVGTPIKEDVRISAPGHFYSVQSLLLRKRINI